MKIGLFGGSFDPIHQGHLSIAFKALKECSLDQLIFLPCAHSPLKHFAPVAMNEQRVDMLQLAVAGGSWASVDCLDMDLPPPSWSWRIAELFRERYVDAELFWLMGGDQWSELAKWRRWEYLAEMVTFIVHFRQGCVPQSMDGVNVVFLEGDHPASSSAIRIMLGEGSPIPEDWLDESVLRYIEAHRIYS